MEKNSKMMMGHDNCCMKFIVPVMAKLKPDFW
jgi:hypothetical protein